MSHAELKNAAACLVQRSLAPLCRSCAIEITRAGTWNSGDARIVSLSTGGKLTLLHDSRGAPYAPREPRLLVSLSDEDDVAICAWAMPRPNSSIAGIGIDLASCSDFAGKRGETYNHLLFSVREQELVASHFATRPEAGFAYAFSAKEAAFKACAAPLRTWYEEHDREDLVFEVREFELTDLTHARGTLRHAHAQAAMDAMGVTSIVLHHCALNNAVLTLALAYQQS